MDPLSITAGIIAIVGAAGQIARVIQQLRDIRHAPIEVKLILEELTDLHDLLQQVKTTSPTHKCNDATFDPPNNGLDRQIRRISSISQELTSLIQDHIPRPTRFGIDRRQLKWIKGKVKANQLLEELKVLRLNLAISVGANTSSQVERVESAIDQFSQQQNENTRVLNALVTTLAPQLPSSPLDFNSATGAVNWPFNVSIESATVPRDEMQIYTKKSISNCKSWCSCNCHKKTVLRAKNGPSTAVGSFSLAYSGLPWFTARCNQKSCGSRSLPAVAMNVQFPAWLWKRYLSLSLTYASISGPNLNLKLLRTVDWYWKLFIYASDGNLRAIQNLFATGAASPWDVSPICGSALHYAARRGQFEVCKFLVDQGALTNQENEFKKTPAELAWDQVLSGDLSKVEVQKVASIFDDTEFLQSRQFTVLHKIVLGLIPKDLENELEYSTADLDLTDSSGRTCTSWAATRGDSQTLRILLENGADPNIPDIQGSTPLHHVRTAECCDLLLRHCATLTRNAYGRTALHSLMRREGSISLVAPLINAGIDVNATDYSCETALCNGAVAVGKQPTHVQYLLARGADPEASTDSGDTLLHLAAIHNTHATLHLLLEHGVDYTRTNKYGHTILHHVARLAGLKSVQVLREHGIEKIDTEAIGHLGKTARDFLDEREEGTLEAGFREAFEGLLEDVASSRARMSKSVHEMAACCTTTFSADADDEIGALGRRDEVEFFDAVEEVEEIPAVAAAVVSVGVAA